MSYRNNNNKSQSFGAVKKTPFCKVCFDAGKSKAEYENHYVRSLPDRTGKTMVTCPTLLSLNCRACGKAGHTVKFCPVIAVEKKAEDKAFRMAELRRKTMEEEKNKHTQRTNMFSGLEDNSDSEEEEQHVAPVVPTLSGWSQVAAKAVSKQTEQELKAEQKAIEAVALKRQIPPMINPVTTTSKWALTESDDEEGDEEDEIEAPYDYEDVTDW
jgi:hypothetical protein